MEQRSKKDDDLYERYGKASEAEHKGEFVAISDDGKIILGKDRLDISFKAEERFGAGRYAFRKIGHAAVGKWLGGSMRAFQNLTGAGRPGRRGSRSRRATDPRSTAGRAA